jgi:hypothetical protein
MNGIMILKWIWNKCDGLNLAEAGTGGGSCQHKNKSLGSVNYGECFRHSEEGAASVFRLTSQNTGTFEVTDLNALSLAKILRSICSC